MLFDGLTPAAAVAAATVFGLLVGSFLNVVILRLPPRLMWAWRQTAHSVLGEDAARRAGANPGDAALAGDAAALAAAEADPRPPGLVVERSRCPKCGHALAPWENVPVLGWLLLRGRCRACKAPISLQYPAVELLTGLAFGLVAWRFGLGVEGLLGLGFTGLLIAASGIDLRTHYLPDELTYPLLWLGLLASTFTVYVGPVPAVLGAAVGWLALWSVFQGFKLLTGKEGMGYGDFKLLAALGAWCGIDAILPIVLLSSLVGAVVGGIWLKTVGRDSDSHIPFGPYLAIAGWIWFLFDAPLMAAYRGWFGMGAG